MCYVIFMRRSSPFLLFSKHSDEGNSGEKRLWVVIDLAHVSPVGEIELLQLILLTCLIKVGTKFECDWIFTFWKLLLLKKLLL